MATEWQKIKNSGSFKRKIEKNYLKTLKSIVQKVNIKEVVCETNTEEVLPTEMEASWQDLNDEHEQGFRSCTPERVIPNDEPLSNLDSLNELMLNRRFCTELKEWAVNCKIKQNALKELITVINRLLFLFHCSIH